MDWTLFWQIVMLLLLFMVLVQMIINGAIRVTLTYRHALKQVLLESDVEDAVKAAGEAQETLYRNSTL